MKSEALVYASVSIFRIGKRASGGDGSLTCRESTCAVGYEVPDRQLLLVVVLLLMLLLLLLVVVGSRVVKLAARSSVLRAIARAVGTSNVTGQSVRLLHVGNVGSARSAFRGARSACGVVSGASIVLRAGRTVERRLVGKTSSKSFGSVDRCMTLVGRVTTGRNRSGTGSVVGYDGAGSEARAAVRSVEMGVRVGHVVRLLLTTANTGDRVRVAAKGCKRRQLGSGRDGALGLTESRFLEVLLISVVIGEGGDGWSVEIRVRRHGDHLVGEVAIPVVSADLRLILLDAGGVLGKHGRGSGTTVLVVRSHGGHGTSSTGTDARLVLRANVVVLLVVL